MLLRRESASLVRVKKIIKWIRTNSRVLYWGMKKMKNQKVYLNKFIRK